MGFNLSWIFVDQIDFSELYAALDVRSTGEAADAYDLGTSEDERKKEPKQHRPTRRAYAARRWQQGA